MLVIALKLVSCYCIQAEGSLQNVVDQEIFTPSSFQVLEISPQLANLLEITILFNLCSSLAVVLGLELQLDRFEHVCLVIFKMAD